MKKPHEHKQLRDVSKPASGADFRKAVAELFEDPEPSDAVLLEQVCELLDRIEEARRAIVTHGVVYPAGKLLRTNPAVQIERDSVRTLLACLRALKLEPEVDLRELEGPTALAQNLRRR